jgi:aryl-alcohol dehydrogenase-like predicted oxidoreductase
MEYRRLGRSGLKVSAIGLGTNQFGGKVDLNGVREIFAAALDLGINLIDTADVYQKGRSEEHIGAALGARRGEVIIATKFFYQTSEGPNDQGGSRHYIIQAAEASLKRLGTDYIDLYQMHAWDADTPIDESMRALEDLVTSGKVRYIGASNYSGWQLAVANELADRRSWNPYVSIQPHYHMLERGIEKELIPACEYLDVGILPYFPLAGGFLTGKYRRGEGAPAGSRGEQSLYVQRYMTDENYGRIETLESFASEREHSLNDLAHAWLLAQPKISSVISGVTSVAHVQSNAAAGEWALSADEASEVRETLEA